MKPRALSQFSPTAILAGCRFQDPYSHIHVSARGPIPLPCNRAHPHSHSSHAERDAARSLRTGFPNTKFPAPLPGVLPAVTLHPACTLRNPSGESPMLQPKKIYCFLTVCPNQASGLHARNRASIPHRGPDWRIQSVPAFWSVGGGSALYKTLGRPRLVMAMKEGIAI